MREEAHPATTGPDAVDLDAFEAFARDPYAGGHSPHEVADTFQRHALKVIAELRAARLDRDHLDGRLQLANEVIDAFREYPSGTMPMVDMRLRDYDATAEGGS